MSPLPTAPEPQLQHLDNAGPLPRRCTNHPDRETYIACGRCERPFCPECLILTPAGQRCYECAGVRRDYAQRNFARRLIQALGASAAGAVIAALLSSSILFVVIVAAVTGGSAGQLLSPLVNRRTRRRVYVLGLLALIGGAFAGWLAVWLLRTMGTPVPVETLVIELARRILQSWLFWVFTAIVAGVGYQRVR